MQTELNAINRVTGSEVKLQSTEGGDGLVVPGGVLYEEVTRAGLAFHFHTTTATAGVTSTPSTAVNCAFRNTADDGGKSMIIDAIYAMQVGNAGATLSGFGIIYVLGQTRVAALTSGGLIPRKNNGMGPSTDTVCIMSLTATALDAVTGVVIGWLPAGPGIFQNIASLPGLVIFNEINGRIIVPPGRILGVHVAAGSTTATWNMGLMWHEKVITLG